MQKLTVEQEKLRNEAYDRLSIWRDGCREYHEHARESRAILALRDPHQDDGNKGKKCVQLQTLKSTFNNCVADQVDNMPEARMIPETPELESVADDLTDIVGAIMMQNDYETVHRKRVEDCFCTGTAVTQIMWDEDACRGKGDVAVIRWPVEAFLWDPASESLDDARAVFKVSWHPKSWFEQHYPDQYDEIGSDEGEYSGLGVPDSQLDQQSMADEDKVMLVEYWYRLYEASKRRYTINVAYLAGGCLLEDFKDVYKHGRYPFVLDVFDPIEGMPVGEGLVQELAPMMRYVNRYQSYIDMNLRMSAKGRLLLQRNSGVDKDILADWENDIIEGDRIDASAVQWLQTAPFTTMATNQILQLQTDIKQDSGQSQFTRGETANGVTAASAISALQEAGGKITRLHTSTLNQGFKEIAEQVMWLISEFYDDERVIMVTGRLEGTMKEIDFDKEKMFGKHKGKGLPPPPYSVRVQVQRRNPLMQQSQNELFMQAYSMSAQAGQIFPLSALFEILQVDGKEKILPVLRNIENYTQQMQQLQQQVQQLGQQNQQLTANMQQLQNLNTKYSQQLGGQKQTDEEGVPGNGITNPEQQMMAGGM